jgi:hypothetical protein
VNLLTLLLAADLGAQAARARQQAHAEAVQRVCEADRYLAWASVYGSPAEIQAAQQVANAWRDYRDSL